MTIEDKLQLELDAIRQEATAAKEQLAETQRERDALRVSNGLDRLLDSRSDITIPRAVAKKLLEPAFQLDADGHLKAERPNMTLGQALDAVIEEYSFMRGATAAKESKGPKLEDLFGPKSNGKLANQFANENPDLYRKLRVEAGKAGLI